MDHALTSFSQFPQSDSIVALLATFRSMPGARTSPLTCELFCLRSIRDNALPVTPSTPYSRFNMSPSISCHEPPSSHPPHPPPSPPPSLNLPSSADTPMCRTVWRISILVSKWNLKSCRFAPKSAPVCPFHFLGGRGGDNRLLPRDVVLDFDLLDALKVRAVCSK